MSIDKTSQVCSNTEGQSKPRQRSYISTSKHYGASGSDKESAANARGRILTLSPTRKKKTKKKKKTNPPRNKKGSDRYSIPADAKRKDFKPRELISIFKANGWVVLKGREASGKGRHTILKNPKKPELGRVTFSRKNNERYYFQEAIRMLDKAGLLDQLPREKPSARHKAQK